MSPAPVDRKRRRGYHLDAAANHLHFLAGGVDVVAYWGVMPDDNFRPTHGLPPDSRPTNVPPEWWSQLDRDDLPKGGREAMHRHDRGDPDEQIIRALRGRRTAERAPSLRRWMTNVALVIIAALLLTIGIDNTTPTGIAAALLVISILALGATAGVQVVRRVRRRP